jgi:preprotein translocase subunit SecE
MEHANVLEIALYGHSTTVSIEVSKTFDLGSNPSARAKKTSRYPSVLLIMNKVSSYFRDSWKELIEKVTWPTWNQLQQSTVIVLVATLVITAMVWIMDFASQNLLKLIYSFFK